MNFEPSEEEMRMQLRSSIVFLLMEKDFTSIETIIKISEPIIDYIMKGKE